MQNQPKITFIFYGSKMITPIKFKTFALRIKMTVFKGFCQWAASIIHRLKKKEKDLKFREQAPEMTFNLAII